MTEELKEKIKKLRQSLGLNQTQFADLVGAEDQSTVSKWERGKQEPNAERAAKMAELAGQSIGEWLNISGPILRVAMPNHMYRVVGSVQAGAWKEAIEWDYDEQYQVAAPFKNMPSFHIQVYEVSGPSMNRVYPHGTLVYVASTIANGISPRNGQKVLVSRRNRDGLYEATLKEYVVNEDGTVWLWPRSYDPEHQAPIQYRTSDAEEVTVTGIVMAATLNEWGREQNR